jgi:Transglycosylase-like domain
MRPKTTIALAVAGALLAGTAAEADPLRPPLGGHETMAAHMAAQARENRRDDLARRTFRVARGVAADNGERFEPKAERRRLDGMTWRELRKRMRVLHDSRFTASPALQAIAACESGGNPATDTGNGFYGKYQFDLQTWQAVGGSGNPAQASEAEQDRRATILYAQAGASPWPVCGR